ncbi:MAG: 23S rRNA (uracil(1939)-C(5))-methyltransferase RlmD [Lachnospiraceae bacterium]|nr:23S rRNA (uracil(1939)-C(5))-methyltransferase RlmD [Lachnospiraceae bacterium]
MRKLEKNELITVAIEDIGFDGAGIGKKDRYAIFIKDAVIGDTVYARIMKAKQNYAYAKLEKVITPSSFRVTPKCEFHRQCGGCQLQALSYDKQLSYKQNKVRNNLIRIGGFMPELVDSVTQPIIGMDEPFRYRNKAQYPVGYSKNGCLTTGFYAGRTHDIVANTDCLLGDERNKAVLEAVLAYMKANNVTAYREQAGTGLARHIFIRSGFYSGEIMVCLVINAKNKANLPRQQDLIESLREIPGMVGLTLNYNPDKTNIIMGKKMETLWGKETLSDWLYLREPEKGFVKTGESISVKLSPLSFYQVNPIQAEKIYSLALNYAQLEGKETVWDLYCGIGTISLFVSGKAKKVYGVEIVPEAVCDARKNALENKIDNVAFFAGKAEAVLPEKLSEGAKADVIIVDPPRKGCNAECLDIMIKIKPKRIVYISCDSATLARDLRIICENGYELKKWRAVDQFGQTVHIETVCLVERK